MVHFHLVPADCYPREILATYENREAADIDGELNEFWDGERRIAPCKGTACRRAGRFVTLDDVARQRDAIYERYAR